MIRGNSLYRSIPVSKERKIQLKYQHFGTSNELRGLGKYQQLLTEQKRNNQANYYTIVITIL